LESYHNLRVLQNLYRLQSLGYEYYDEIQQSSSSKLSIPKTLSLQELEKQIAQCHLCDFSKSRTQSMYGYGSTTASVMIVDYSVSEVEDSTNEYFCGRSGELLEKMINSVLELSKEEIFFTHLIKCKPLASLQSFTKQIDSCKHYLLTQIKLIQPKVIVLLGEKTFSGFFGKENSFEELRGHILKFEQINTIAIYHPSFLLRNPNLKKIAFYDLKTIKSCL